MLLENLTVLAISETDTRAVRRTATRERILEAAWEQGRAEGLAGVSLRDVGAAVGMRAPSLYTYFPSKNAMYDAMYAVGAQELLDWLAQGATTDDPEVTFRNRVRAFVQFCLADPLRYQLIFERPVPEFEPSPESFAITVRALAETQRQLEAAGVHGEESLDLLRAVVTGLITLQVANDPGGDRWARLLDQALDMFFAHHGRSGERPEGRGARVGSPR
jgi:AcrR family transcriptional regulator